MSTYLYWVLLPMCLQVVESASESRFVSTACALNFQVSSLINIGQKFWGEEFE